MSMKNHHLSLHMICEIVTTINLVKGSCKGFLLNFLSQRGMNYKEFHLELLLIEKISFTKDYTSKKFPLNNDLGKLGPVVTPLEVLFAKDSCQIHYDVISIFLLIIYHFFMIYIGVGPSKSCSHTHVFLDFLEV